MSYNFKNEKLAFCNSLSRRVRTVSYDKRETVYNDMIFYEGMLPNRKGLSVTKIDSSYFYDNDFSLWFSNKLENNIPQLPKRLCDVTYNYVGRKND